MIYFIMGGARTGTSLVASLLHNAGISMGEWLPGMSSYGYETYEEVRFSRMANIVIPDWSTSIDVSAIPYINWRQYFLGMQDETGLKHPKLLPLYPFIRDDFQNGGMTRYIFTHRQPASAIAGLVLSGLQPEEAKIVHSFYSEYQKFATWHIAPGAQFTVDYDDLIDKEECRVALFDWMGMPYDGEKQALLIRREMRHG